MTRVKRARWWLSVLIAGSAFGGGFEWDIPKGFPRPAVPVDNPMSAAKVQLGRYLFYDQRLSVNEKESCASCHRQELAFTDGRAHAEGTTGQLHPRSSMSLVNVAYAPYLTWANPSLSALEEQALGPMLGEQPVELGLSGHESEVIAKLRREPVYGKLFPQSFPGEPDPFTLANVTKALAAFERTIVSMRSPYDRYRWGGEPNAISEAAKRGEIVFASSEKAGCFQCHGGWNFSGDVMYEGAKGTPRMGEGSFFNTGTVRYSAPNRGMFEHIANAQDLGKFRAPTLRNIAVTAPYMHDGSMATLEEVIDHYAEGGKFDSPNKSRMIHPLNLTKQDKSDLIEFLKSLTDEELLRDPRWGDPWAKLSGPER